MSSLSATEKVLTSRIETPQRLGVGSEGHRAQIDFCRRQPKQAFNAVERGNSRSGQHTHHKESVQHRISDALILILIGQRAEKLQRADFEINFFANFAAQRVLSRLANIDKSARQTELALARILSATQEQSTVVVSQQYRSHSRGGAEVLDVSARGAVKRIGGTARTLFPAEIGRASCRERV